MKYDNFLNIVKNKKSICIIGHIDPDADALSSMTVLKDFLTNHLKTEIVDIFAETNEVQENCKSIIFGHTLNPSASSYDLAIAVDTPNVDRLGKYGLLFKNSNETITIDHHNTNQLFGNFNIVENTSSTSEIIFSMLESFNYKFTTSNYENIYAGIITDTNNFTTPNVTENTFLIASKIIEKIDHIKIYNNFFSNFSINNMKLLSYAIKNIISLKNNKIIISYLTKNHFKKSNSTINDITGIINKLSTISENIFTCLIFFKNNNYYVSLRAKNGYNVANIAKKYNGGGHIGAAGFLTKNNLNKIIKIIKKEFLNLI